MLLARKLAIQCGYLACPVGSYVLLLVKVPPLRKLSLSLSLSLSYLLFRFWWSDVSFKELGRKNSHEPDRGQFLFRGTMSLVATCACVCRILRDTRRRSCVWRAVPMRTNRQPRCSSVACSSSCRPDSLPSAGTGSELISSADTPSSSCSCVEARGEMRDAHAGKRGSAVRYTTGPDGRASGSALGVGARGAFRAVWHLLPPDAFRGACCCVWGEGTRYLRRAS